MANWYMCHPFDSRFEMRKWELRMEVKFDIEIINPFYDLHRDDVLSIDEGRYERYGNLDPDSLVDRDLEAIADSDWVMAYVNGDLSYGTIMEIAYAAGMLGKPVYIVCTNGHEKHPWLVHHAEEVFTSLDKFEVFLGER